MRLPGEQISQLLHEADDFHHRVFRIADGADDDLGELIGRAAAPPEVSTGPAKSALAPRARVGLAGASMPPPLSRVRSLRAIARR